MRLRRASGTTFFATIALVAGTFTTAGPANTQPTEVENTTTNLGPSAQTLSSTAVTPRRAKGPGFNITHQLTGDGGLAGVRDSRQSLINIADASAPQRFLFDVDLPEGARLEKSGKGLVTRTKSGDVVAALTPPWALNADRISVATRFEIVDRDTFAQVVEHRVLGSYPVIADPWYAIPVLVRGGQIIRHTLRAASMEAAKRAAAREIARQIQQSIEDVKARDGRRLLKLNRRNFRQNVIRRTGWSKETMAPYDAHHTLPIKWEGFFNEAGINIHNPIFGHPWCRSDHQSKANAFNRDWGKFRGKYADRVRNDDTSRRVIEDYRIRMVSKYSAGYQCANRRQNTEEAWQFDLVQPGSVRR